MAGFSRGGRKRGDASGMARYPTREVFSFHRNVYDPPFQPLFVLSTLFLCGARRDCLLRFPGLDGPGGGGRRGGGGEPGLHRSPDRERGAVPPADASHGAAPAPGDPDVPDAGRLPGRPDLEFPAHDRLAPDGAGVLDPAFGPPRDPRFLEAPDGVGPRPGGDAPLVLQHLPDRGRRDGGVRPGEEGGPFPVHVPREGAEVAPFRPLRRRPGRLGVLRRRHRDGPRDLPQDGPGLPLRQVQRGGDARHRRGGRGRPRLDHVPGGDGPGRVPLRGLLRQPGAGEAQLRGGGGPLRLPGRPEEGRDGGVGEGRGADPRGGRHRGAAPLVLHGVLPVQRADGRHQRGRPLLQRLRQPGPRLRPPVLRGRLDLGHLPGAPPAADDPLPRHGERHAQLLRDDVRAERLAAHVPAPLRRQSVHERVPLRRLPPGRLPEGESGDSTRRRATRGRSRMSPRPRAFPGRRAR